VSQQPLIISFPESLPAEANRQANSLSEALLDAGSGLSVEHRRDRPDTQDFGATLALILGTTAVSAVAKGIATWLARNSGAKIEIRRDDRVILTATHVDSRDVPRITEALMQR
jgi:hypothetical protein